MPGYDFKTAKAVLNENDKDRLLACYLNITDMQAVDWKKAAADFGSASVESFKVMIRNALKKIDKADAANGGGDGAATPKSSAKKRKAAAAPADVDDEEGADTPIKKRGRPAKGSAKKAKTEAKAEEGGEGEDVKDNAHDVVVKEEMDFD